MTEPGPTRIENRTIGPYSLIRKLDGATSGADYLAERAEGQSRRQATVKLIKPDANIGEILARLERQRTNLIGLEHPNIACLFDAGATEDGWLFFAMESVQGEPILSYCDRHKLSIRDRVNLVIQMCSALEQAHERHIVHRNLKPRSIRVTAEGTPKLLETGIATVLNPGLGSEVMELEYASPEQARGGPVSAATDVYALAVVLYTLLAGHRVFGLAGRRFDDALRMVSEEIPVKPSFMMQRAEIVTGEDGEAVAVNPRWVAELRGTLYEELRRALTSGLDHIVLRALRKDPLERYASAAALASDLQSYLDGKPLARDFVSGGTRERATDVKDIAAPPFTVLRTEQGGDEYWGVALADALATRLKRVQRLSVRAGREGAEYVLEGRILQAGAKLRVQAQVIRSGDHAMAGSAQFEAAPGEILNLEDSLCGMLADALGLSNEERELLKERETQHTGAHESYLRGRYYAGLKSEDGWVQALTCLRDAIGRDPDYARAHLGVAQSQASQGFAGARPPGDCFAAAKDAAAKALALDPSLAEALVVQASVRMALDWDWAAAEADLRRAIQLTPANPDAHCWLAILLSVRLRHSEALAEIESARKLDPHSLAWLAMAGSIFVNARQPDRALEELRRADLSTDAEAAWIHLAFARTYGEMRNYSEAILSAQRAVDDSSRSQAAVALLAYLLGCAGQTEKARELQVELEQLSQDHFVSHYLRALINVGLDERGAAITKLEKAAFAHDGWLMGVASEPGFEPLRGLTRFQRLVEKLGLPAIGRASGAAEQAHETPAFTMLREARPRRRTILWLSAGALVAGAAAIVANRARREPREPRRHTKPLFANPKLHRLSGSGDVDAAAISPDGRLVAYVTNSSGMRSLWLKRTDAGNAWQVAPPVPVEVGGLWFSGDNQQVDYLVNAGTAPTSATLFQVPVRGGAPRELKENSGELFSFSPGHRRRAVLRRSSGAGLDELLVLSEDSGAERKLATLQPPQRFAAVAPVWSADGLMLACAVEDTDSGDLRLTAFRLDTGREEGIGQRRWQSIDQLAWSGRDNTLIVSARQQLWAVRFPGGEDRKLIQGQENFRGVSLMADSSALVTVQTSFISRIWEADRRESEELEPITLESGRYPGVACGAEDSIVYVSDAGDSSDIRSTLPDGTNPKQLTSGAGRNESPAVAPDGRSIAFQSNRSGAWNIWRMDPDGGNVAQLSRQPGDGQCPQWSADSKWVFYYLAGPANDTTIWKVPANGGAPVQVTNRTTSHPAISPTGGRMACWYLPGDSKTDWKMAILDPDSGQPIELFACPEGVSPNTSLRWTSDGNEILFIAHQPAGNIWLQPLSGVPPHAITQFTDEQIYSFDWSRMGKLVLSRGHTTGDVVLVTES